MRTKTRNKNKLISNVTPAVIQYEKPALITATPHNAASGANVVSTWVNPLTLSGLVCSLIMIRFCCLMRSRNDTKLTTSAARKRFTNGIVRDQASVQTYSPTAATIRCFPTLDPSGAEDTRNGCDVLATS